MNVPAQQKAPESLARLEGGVTASLTEKDNTIMAQTADTVTSTADWKHELVYSTPGVFRPADVLNMLRKVHTLDVAKSIVQRESPTYAAPVNQPLPFWATTSDEWSWVDGEWQRVAMKPSEFIPGRGFTVSVLEIAHADGTLSRTSPTLDVKLPGADIEKTSDAVALAVLATAASMDFALAMSAWKDGIIATTDGLANPAETRSMIENIDDVLRVEEIVAQGIPTVPRPTVAAPDWADQVDEWAWLGGPDQQWHRRCSRDVDVPDSDGQGVSLYSYQYVGADGTARADEPIVAADIQIDSVSNVRELAAWFAAAAETIETSAA